MARLKSVFVCQHCGYESPKWMGRCPGCDEWNTMTEEILSKTDQRSSATGRKGSNPVPMDEIDLSKETRNTTGMEELDRVLGGGIVRGSLVLVGGDPGIGKSTLLLQLAGSVSPRQRVLYVSGEESVKQIKIRGERLGISSGNIFILGETDIDIVLDQVKRMTPDMIIVDSIQTVYTPEFHPLLERKPGKGSYARLLQAAKAMAVPIFIIGHVTKQEPLQTQGAGAHGGYGVIFRGRDTTATG